MQECITVDEVRAMKIGIYAVCTAFVALHSGVVAHAMTLNETSALCETAARDAADHYAIPPQILHTLALTESGRTIDGRLRPWPWAINQSGESSWFGSQAEMLAAANALVSSGIVNFDIGCFQLNYRWHAQHFSSVADMADPGQNAQYAASFLRSKFRETGAWQSAVGAYHSQTAAKAHIYLARFESIFNRWAGAVGAVQNSPPVETKVAEIGVNSFPLLIAGQGRSGASLVPVLQARQRLIGADR